MIAFLSDLGLKDPYLRFLLITFFSVVLGIIVRFIFFKTLFLLNSKKSRKSVEFLQDRFEGSIFLFLPALIIHGLIPKFGLPSDFQVGLHIFTEALIIISFMIVAIRLVYFLQDLLYGKINDEESVKGRQVLTQIIFTRKIIVFVIIIISICLVIRLRKSPEKKP